VSGRAAEILQIAPLVPEVQARLEAEYRVHDLRAAADGDALLEVVGPRVRAVVTDGHSGVARDVVERLPNLEIIAANGVGYDNIDVPWCRARGIHVTNTPGVLDAAVAEMAVGLMVALARRIPQADAWVRAGRWAAEGNFSHTGQLAGGRVGILGLGRIGKGVARRCEAFEMEVRYCGRSRQDVPWEYVESPEALARDSDWLVAVLPATPATRGIVGRAVLEALGPEGFFVNIGRGALHDEAALIEFCRGRIASYKIPKSVDFADQPLPKTGPGKIAKRRLRDPYWKDQDRNI
jgi:lactate dehydrogenase-like 2-hydroxyacid dehydrogenase